jgi:FkbM family methyltransferase
LKILFIVIIISFIFTDIIINIGILKNKKIENMFLNLKNDLYVLNLKMKSFMKTDDFNEIKNEEYLKKQNYFCENQNKYYNYEFEKKLKLEKVNFNNNIFSMFIYKSNDIVSNGLSTNKVWEQNETDNIIKALEYYSRKKHLTEKDIYIMDVGGNVGWYTFLLGKYGYKILTFEPSQINFYILNKNYCLNKGLNITLINKGLFPEEKKCYIHSPKNNIGNGFISCKKISEENDVNNGEIILTKLSNYIPFFMNKNLALIKIDIEGSEGKAFESGIELLTEYHVPFIIMEFTPKALISFGTDPKQFLEIFINNGYKINLLNFFETKTYEIEYFLKEIKDLGILYIVYTKILQ